VLPVFHDCPGYFASKMQADLRMPRQVALNRLVLRRNRRLGIARVGVFGGTFNPIHFGHLHIAERIQKAFSLSQVYFVVATVPPHKLHEDLIPFVHRYAMVSLAVAGIPSFISSMIELEPEASPFSIDTMKKFECSPGRDTRDLFFIAGGDSLAEVQSWRDSEKLLTSYNFVFADRPGTGPVSYEDVLPEKAVARVRDLTGLGPVQIRRKIAAEDSGENRIYIADVGAPDISATCIRGLASAGKSICRMVPGPVCEYIRKHHLYGE
jgi:nicotinate-nucleotide adenylyltransferase